MKIIIDARFFGTETGIGRYVKEVVENLENIDSKNQYVIFLCKENWNLYNPKNLNFKKKLVDIKWYSAKEQFRLGKIVDEEKANLCHFPHFNIPFFCKTPYIITIHDLILRHFSTTRASTIGPIRFYLKYLAYKILFKRSLKQSKKIIVPSYFVRNDILKNFKINPDKVRVIYEGLSNLPKDVDLGLEYLKEKGIRVPFILYVGNSYPHKNLEKLIEAFYLLKENGESLQLVLVGKRDYFSKRLECEVIKKYNKFAKKYPDDIVFYGYASDSELVTIYKRARSYIFPSLMEGFGLPPLEALSFDLPVICSDIPVLHEVLGNSATYFNPNSAENIKNVLAEHLSDRQTGTSTKLNFSKYDFKKNVEEIKEVYEKYDRKMLS